MPPRAAGRRDPPARGPRPWPPVRRPWPRDVRTMTTAITRAGVEVEIAPMDAGDVEPLFALFAEVVASGEGYPHAPPLTRETFEATWIRPVTAVVVARIAGQGAGGAAGRADGALAGAYYLKPNFPGRAAHIANAGYMVAARHRGQGIGRALVEDSIRRAPGLGFDALQFNLVFASNPARALYEELGWREIGRIPDAVGGEEAVIYWRAV